MTTPARSPESTFPRAYSGAALDAALEARRQYQVVRGGAAPGAPITALHIGAQHTAVTSGCDTEPSATLVLAIGAQKTARDFFRRSPPTPLEMENAIATVEDEVTRAVELVASGSTLYGSDPLVREIARLAGVASSARGVQITLTLDAMEQTFNRLVAVAEGRPARQEGLPDNAEFAAALLILREFMHHLRFDAITLPA
jgi:exopolyphosphatase/pppGpp-phosphohydrolase